MIILQQTRGVLSSGDQLVLDLPFDESGSFASRVGPTPIITRASTGTAVSSNGFVTTIANNQPRITYNPVTLKPVGMLIESGSINLMLHSQDLLQSNWTKTGCSVASDSAISPDGTFNADKIIESTTNGLHFISQSLSLSQAAYTFSFYAKAAEREWVCASFGGSTSTVWFNLSEGRVGITSGSATLSNRIENAGNGWWRCSMVSLLGAASIHDLTVRVAPSDGVSNYQGNGISGVYLWGFQNEMSYGSTYIPTTAQARSRAADICDILSSDFLKIFNQNDLTLCVSAIKNNILTTTSALSVTDGTPSNYIQIITSVSRYEGIQGAANGVAFTGLTLSQSTVGQKFKASFSIKANDLAASMNGSILSKTTNAKVPILTEMNIGRRRSFVNNNYLNGIICSVKVYRKRIPDTKLRPLSSL